MTGASEAAPTAPEPPDAASQYILLSAALQLMEIRRDAGEPVDDIQYQATRLAIAGVLTPYRLDASEVEAARLALQAPERQELEDAWRAYALESFGLPVTDVLLATGLGGWLGGGAFQVGTKWLGIVEAVVSLGFLSTAIAGWATDDTMLEYFGFGSIGVWGVDIIYSVTALFVHNARVEDIVAGFALSGAGAAGTATPAEVAP